MNAIMYANLSAEVNTLEKMLAEIPEDDVIDRFGLENRLAEVKAQLGTTNEYHITHKAKLTFRGAPVIKSEAISATFAAKATNLFTDAVSLLCATLNNFDVKNKGRIPDCVNNQLMITGTAVGSFGFEFELPKPDTYDLCPEKSAVEIALENIRNLLEVSATGSDDSLSDIVEDIHPRVRMKIEEFLSFQHDQKAKCGLEFKNKFFRFETDEQLENALFRLKEDNIHEKIQIFEGVLQGCLPVSRTFEFQINDPTCDTSLIKGKVGRDIDRPDFLNKNWLGKKASITLTVISIGNSQPKYILKSLKDIV